MVYATFTFIWLYREEKGVIFYLAQWAGSEWKEKNEWQWLEKEKLNCDRLSSQFENKRKVQTYKS